MLLLLAQQDAPLRYSQARDEMGLYPQAFQRALDRLEQRGLVGLRAPADLNRPHAKRDYHIVLETTALGAFCASLWDRINADFTELARQRNIDESALAAGAQWIFDRLRARARSSGANARPTPRRILLWRRAAVSPSMPTGAAHRGLGGPRSAGGGGPLRLLRVIHEHDVRSYVVYWPLGARLHGLGVELGHLLTRMSDSLLAPEDVYLLAERRALGATEQGTLAWSKPATTKTSSPGDAPPGAGRRPRRFGPTWAVSPGNTTSATATHS